MKYDDYLELDFTDITSPPVLNRRDFIRTVGGGIFIFIYGLFLAIYCLATKKWWEGGRKWTWGIFGILVVVYLVVLLVLGLKAARPPTEDSQKSE